MTNVQKVAIVNIIKITKGSNNMTDQKNELIEVIQVNGLEQSKVESLMMSFAQNYQLARDFVGASKSITVTGEDDKEGMKKAREARLSLRKIRTDVEHTRISLKEQSLRESRAIDGAANIIKALIAPAEDRLEELEKFAEIAKQNREMKIIADRMEKLRQYVSDVSIYRLEPDNMSDAIFDNLLANLKSAKEAENAARAKAETEASEKLAKQQQLQDRAVKIAPYTRFYPKGFELTVDTTDEQFDSAFDYAKKGQQKYDQDQEKIRLDNEKLIKERETREIQIAKEKKVQDEKLAKEKADREKIEKQIANDKERERVRIESEQKAKDEADRVKLLAPDKEKLIDLASAISKLQLPAVQSNEAGAVIRATKDMLAKVTNYINERAKTL